MNRLLTIAFLLTFVGGYADAASYLLTRSFTGHLTGNTVFLMLHLTNAEWRAALSNALAVAAFAAGTTLAAFLDADSGVPKEARALRRPLWVEAGFLALAAGCHGWGGAAVNDLTVMCLCLGLGMQNGALRRCGALSVHSTFITGMSTTLLTNWVRRVEGREKLGDTPQHSPGILAGIMGIFALGAGAGAWLSRRFEPWGFAGIFLPLALALILTTGEKQNEG